MLNTSAGTIGVTSSAIREQVSVHSDRVSDRDMGASTNGVSRHLGASPVNGLSVGNISAPMLDDNALPHAASARADSGGDGHAAVMHVDDTHDDQHNDVMAMSPPDSIIDIIPGEAHLGAHPNAVSIVSTAAAQVAATRPRSISAEAVLPSVGDDETTNAMAQPPHAAIKSRAPPGRKVYDWQLAAKIPRINGMNAESIIVEFSIPNGKLRTANIFGNDTLLGRELVRVRLGQTGFNVAINPLLTSLINVVNAIKSTTEIRLIGPIRKQLMDAVQMLKRPGGAALASHNSSIRLKMSWTFADSEAAETATAALDGYCNSDGDTIFTTSPGTAVVTCGQVAGVPTAWRADDLLAFIKYNLRGVEAAENITDEIAFERVVNRVALATHVCNFAMSPKALKMVTNMSTVDPRTGLDVKLEWALKERDRARICGNCLSTEHTSKDCQKPPRCYVCGGSGHGREHCSTQSAAPCYICRTHTGLLATHAAPEHTTSQCPHLKTSLIVIKSARAGPQSSRQRPSSSSSSSSLAARTGHPSVSGDGVRSNTTSSSSSSYASRVRVRDSDRARDGHDASGQLPANAASRSVPMQQQQQLCTDDYMNLMMAKLQEMLSPFATAAREMSSANAKITALERRLAAQDQVIAAQKLEITTMKADLAAAIGKMQTVTVAAVMSAMAPQSEKLDSLLARFGVDGVVMADASPRAHQQQQPAQPVSMSLHTLTSAASAASMPPPAVPARERTNSARRNAPAHPQPKPPAIVTTNRYGALSSAAVTTSRARDVSPPTSARSTDTPANTARRVSRLRVSSDDDNGDNDDDSDDDSDDDRVMAAPPPKVGKRKNKPQVEPSNKRTHQLTAAAPAPSRATTSSTRRANE